jgi:branched-chain amino acid transport system substrate-binding protein
MRFRVPAVRFIAASVCVVLGVVSSMPSDAEGSTYQIDVIESLSGPGAFAGLSHQRTLAVFEQYVNAHGGVRGRPIHFVYHDDESNAATAVQLAAAVVATHPPIVLGPGAVATCAAAAPLFQNGGPVQYCLSPGYTPRPGGFSFAASSSIDYLCATILRYVRLRGYTNIAVLSTTDATGQASDKATDGVLARAENRSMTLVAREHFNPTDVSVAAQIARIKAQHPQALVVWTVGTPFGTVLRGMSDAGLDIPVFTSGANMSKDQLRQYRTFLPPGLYFNSFRFFDPAHIAPGPLLNNVRDFYAAFSKAGVPAAPDSSYSWDVGLIAVSALKDLGFTASPERVRDYINNLTSFVGINGLYDFQTHDQHGLTDSANLMVRWDPKRDTWIVVSKPFGIPYVPEP